MKQLPNELIAQIIEEAQYNDCLPRYAWLRQYSLVGHAWRYFAQRLLFRRVVLMRGAKQCTQFIAALSKENSKDASYIDFLRSCVKILVVGMDHQSVYANAILLCPNLFELSACLYHASFRQDVLQRLRRGPKLQALRVQSAYFRPLYQLLELFPDVQYLSINALSTSIPCSRFTPKWRLRELRLHCRPSQVSDLLYWVLPNVQSREHLEVLHLDNAESNVLTSLEFPGLRSLHLNGIRRQDLERLHHLEELALRSHAPSETLLESMPSTLQHLSLPAIIENVPIEEILRGLAAFQERTDFALRVLSYPRVLVVGQPEGDREIRAVQTFCHTHGVTLRFFSPPYGKIQGEMEPLGEIQKFPRNMPISASRKPLREDHIDSDTPPVHNSIRTRLKHRVNSIAKATSSSLKGANPLSLARP